MSAVWGIGNGERRHPDALCRAVLLSGRSGMGRLAWILAVLPAFVSCRGQSDAQTEPVDAAAAMDSGVGRGPDGASDGDASTLGKPASPCKVGCDDANLCTIDVCEPWGVCEHFAKQCFDGNACTKDGCEANAGCTHTAYSCDDGDLCTSDTCEPSAGCKYTKTGCSDNNPCTLDVCAKNACQSTAIADGAVCASAAGMCVAGKCSKDGCAAGLGVFPLAEKPGFRAWRAAAVGNGHFVVAGFFDGSPVVKQKLLLLNGDGSVQTQIPLGGSDLEISQIVPAADGALLICGVQYPANGLPTAWFGRSDKFGPVVPTLFANPLWYSCTELMPMEDGGAVLGGAGGWSGNDSGPPWLARVSASGTVLWEKQVALQDYNPVLRLSRWSNGDIAAVVTSYPVGKPLTTTLRRFAVTGEQLGQKVVESTDVYAIYRLLPSVSGQMRGLGTIWLGDNTLSAGIVRFGSDGSRLWTVPLPGKAAEQVVATADGGAVIALTSDGGLTVVRLDAADNLVSTVAPQFAEKVALTAAFSAPNGQIGLLGLGGYDANSPVGVLPYTSSWLALADPWGHLTCATAGKCATLTTCEDGDGCTLDNCLPASGCNHVILPKGATCATN